MASVKGRDVGYIRLNPLSSNPPQSFEDVILYKSFTEKGAANDSKRPILDKCISYLKSSDCLHLHSFEHLASSIQNLESRLAELGDNGVTVVFHKDKITFNPEKETQHAKLMLHMLHCVINFEKCLAKERQQEGILKAQAAGKQVGRKRVLSDDQIEEIKLRLNAGESKSSLAKEYGIARQTLYSVIQQELYYRFLKVKTIAMMEMREKMGAVELVNWWKNFLGSIPKGATFEDISDKKQHMLLKWEKKLKSGNNF